MSRYLMKFVGKYRVKTNLDLETNDVPRDEHGVIDPDFDDIYIKCAKNAQIYHYGDDVLVAYVPSLGRAHNILIAMAKDLHLIPEESASRDYETLYSTLNQDGTIYDIRENSEEIEFKFRAKDIEFVAKYLQPQTSGASISPFSSKNLPKASYEIPTEDLEEYLRITSVVPKKDKLKVGHLQKRFIKDILSIDNSYKDIDFKSDMKKKMLKGKEYIHSIGAWDKYMNYLQQELQED